MSGQHYIFFDDEKKQSCLDLLNNTKKYMKNLETYKNYDKKPSDNSLYFNSASTCIGDNKYPSCQTFHYNCHEFENFVSQNNATNKTKIYVHTNQNNTIQNLSLKLYGDVYDNKVVDVELY